MRAGVSLIEDYVGGFKREPAAAVRRIPALTARLSTAFSSSLASARSSTVPAKHGFDLDGLAERALQELRDPSHEPVGVDRFGLQRLLAGKREKARGQFCRPSGCIHRRIQHRRDAGLAAIQPSPSTA